MKTQWAAVFLLFVLLMGYERLSAQTWSTTVAPQADWLGVASSADGNKLVAVCFKEFFNLTGIYVSTNRGQTWAPTSAPANPNTNRWSSVASSADGVKLVAVSESAGSIYVSTDSGNSWKSTTAPADDYVSVASSPDGTKLAAAAYNQHLIFTSPDSGATWTQTAAIPPVGVFHSVTISGDGTKLTAAASTLGELGGGGIIYSTNSGISWHLSDAPTQWCWYGLASSTNGNILVAAALGDTNLDPGPVYVSTNAGVNWKPTTAPMLAYGCAACSADGTKMTVAFSGYGVTSAMQVYSSTDTGKTWNLNQNIIGATALASSADGSKLVAGVNNILVSPPLSSGSAAPLITARKSGTNFIISWPTNDASYVLQSATNLATGTWSNTSSGIVATGTNYVFTNSITGKALFFRLQQ